MRPVIVSANHPARRMTAPAIRIAMEQIARNRSSAQLVRHELYQTYRALLQERTLAGTAHPAETLR